MKIISLSIQIQPALNLFAVCVIVVRFAAVLDPAHIIFDPGVFAVSSYPFPIDPCTGSHGTIVLEIVVVNPFPDRQHTVFVRIVLLAVDSDPTLLHNTFFIKVISLLADRLETGLHDPVAVKVIFQLPAAVGEPSGLTDPTAVKIISGAVNYLKAGLHNSGRIKIIPFSADLLPSRYIAGRS